MIKVITLGLVATATGLIMGATALSAQAAPPADSNGCHGKAVNDYRQAHQDPNSIGSAIGGLGNSDAGDPDPALGQAHSEKGRGQTLQEFLAAECGVGSLK